MEELFITKIKESPLTGALNHNMTSQTIRSFVPYVTSYNTLLRSSGYFISGFHFSISLTFTSRSFATFSSGILSFKSELKCTPCQGQIKKKGFVLSSQ